MTASHLHQSTSESLAPVTVQASSETLRARDVERRLYAIYMALGEQDGENLSDLTMAARLAWMESGRVLERWCERDGIDRWTYRWRR